MLYEKTTVAPWTMALLRKIQSIDAFQSFYLGGGTNLALRFWHRISVDLDFFTSEKFDEEMLHQLIILHFPSAINTSKRRQTLNYTIDNIKVDILYFPYENIRDPEIIDGIRMISVPDVIAMKLSALQKRTVKKDYYDILKILEHYSVQQIIEFYIQKFPNTDPGHIIYMLYMAHEADNDVDPILLERVSWKSLKKKLLNYLNQYVDSQIV